VILISLFFSFHAPATTEIYTLSLHDALPILKAQASRPCSTIRSVLGSKPHSPSSAAERTLTLPRASTPRRWAARWLPATGDTRRSEEHTSELQSRGHLVCRLLLEKKKKKIN